MSVPNVRGHVTKRFLSEFLIGVAIVVACGFVVLLLPSRPTLAEQVAAAARRDHVSSEVAARTVLNDPAAGYTAGPDSGTEGGQAIWTKGPVTVMATGTGGYVLMTKGPYSGGPACFVPSLQPDTLVRHLWRF